MPSKGKDQKTPAQRADDRALRDLKSAHPAEYDKIRKQHADKLKEKEGIGK